MSTGQSSVLNKSRVAASFKASSATYEEHAVVQKDVSLRLLSLLDGVAQNLQKTFPVALEIGCCTGFLTAELVNRFCIQTIYLNDLVKDFCLLSAARIDSVVTNAEILDGDIEGVSLPNNLDLVISSATLQWMTDLCSLVKKVSLALEPGGLFVFSIFGPGTMKEIETLTGRCLNYQSAEDIYQSVGRYFDILKTHQEQHVLYFPTVRGVLRHIKATGVGGLGQKERWTHSRFRQFELAYVSQFGTDEGLPVTYDSIYLIAQKRL